MDALLDNCHDTQGGVFTQIVTSDQEPPTAENVFKLSEPHEGDLNKLKE
jgi:hypothetical protein